MNETGPNFIVFLADNMGYGDMGCYGSSAHRTPHMDRLAAESVRFTDYYSTSGVCTPSRTSLMTGCYPRRVNMHVDENGNQVLFPVSCRGLHPNEITIARLLKDRGYATACVGKWHLGDQPPFLPTRHGFDRFFGCPYSEDMVPDERRPHWPPLPLMRDEQVVEAPADRTDLTKRYTEEAVRFIRENRNRPFFLYLPHAMPGSTDRPFASEAFARRSANGPYGDAIEELDWSAGEIAAVLDELGLTENTLFVLTSDNGAVRYDPPQGSNAPLKGWGYDTSEGAQRVPCIMRWPGRIAPGAVCDELISMMDILPTFARLAGTEPPSDRIIDGQDIAPFLFGGTDARSRYDDDGFFYYHMEQLQAVRSGPWKFYLPLEEKILDLRGTVQPCPLALYNVRDDLGETREVSAEHPDVVEHLLRMAGKARKDLGDLGREGAHQRPAGRVDQASPRVVG